MRDQTVAGPGVWHPRPRTPVLSRRPPGRNRPRPASGL